MKSEVQDKHTPSFAEGVNELENFYFIFVNLYTHFTYYMNERCLLVI